MNLIFYFINFYVWIVNAEIHVSTIELRPPKWHDIGLIFGKILLFSRLRTRGFDFRCKYCKHYWYPKRGLRGKNKWSEMLLEHIPIWPTLQCESWQIIATLILKVFKDQQGNWWIFWTTGARRCDDSVSRTSHGGTYKSNTKKLQSNFPLPDLVQQSWKLCHWCYVLECFRV